MWGAAGCAGVQQVHPLRRTGATARGDLKKCNFEGLAGVARCDLASEVDTQPPFVSVGRRLRRTETTTRAGLKGEANCGWGAHVAGQGVVSPPFPQQAGILFAILIFLRVCLSGTRPHRQGNLATESTQPQGKISRNNATPLARWWCVFLFSRYGPLTSQDCQVAIR